MSNEPIPRLSRLSAILTMLQSTKLITAHRLSDKFGVSQRTIYRDIKALLESGIPIQVIEGKGYSLMEGYNLPPIMFTESEANALITAHQIIKNNKDKSLVDNYSDAIAKIKSVLRGKNKEKTELLEHRIAYIQNNKREISSDNLMVIQSAITNQKIAFIIYKTQYENKTTQREIEPLAIYHTQENWILIAWCRLRSNYREFRLDRIKKLNLTGEKYNDRKFDLLNYFKTILDR